MTDTPKKTVSGADKTALLTHIEELETILLRKKTETQKQQEPVPTTGIGTDDIPILVKTVVKEDLISDTSNHVRDRERNPEIVHDIINRIDQKISQKLSELTVLLKKSIMDEVKTRLLQELGDNDNQSRNKQKTHKY